VLRTCPRPNDVDRREPPRPFEYHIEERHEAGHGARGWEIKAIRAGQVQLTDGYVVIRDGELC
jgi:tmRNA-binding protein